MSKQNHIPENDPDLLLARQYGELLSGEKSTPEPQDPLLAVLFKARKREHYIEADIPVYGEESGWMQIENAISHKDQKRPSKVRQLPASKKWYWAAAAVALFAITSVLLLRQPGKTDRQLVADAGSALSTVELADGSSVTLRPNSRLYAVSQTGTEHRYSLSGEALFEVEPSPDRSFSVEAGPGRVVVTGTLFNLSDRNQKSEVHLLEGEIMFETSDRHQTVRLSSGEAAVIDADNRLVDPYLFESDEVIGWTKHRLTFRDREAASIFAELEFHFDIDIEAPAETEQETLGGSIPLDNAEQSLEDLGIVLEGRFVQTDDATYQFRPDQ